MLSARSIHVGKSSSFSRPGTLEAFDVSKSALDDSLVVMQVSSSGALLTFLRLPLLQLRTSIIQLSPPTQGDVRYLRDIEQFYTTQIEEMPMNVADLI